MPELRTARENARLEIGSQRGRNSHQIGVLGIYDLRGLNYGRTELLVADMRHLEPDATAPRANPHGGSPETGRPVQIVRVAGSHFGCDGQSCRLMASASRPRGGKTAAHANATSDWRGRVAERRRIAGQGERQSAKAGLLAGQADVQWVATDRRTDWRGASRRRLVSTWLRAK